MLIMRGGGGCLEMPFFFILPAAHKNLSNQGLYNALEELGKS